MKTRKENLLERKTFFWKEYVSYRGERKREKNKSICHI
jgi:hypothetical protein